MNIVLSAGHGLVHMEWLPADAGVVCLACGRTGTVDDGRCSTCGGLLEVRPHPGLDSIGDRPQAFEERQVGETPLCESTWLSEELGGATVYLKDEGRNPTGHISDRGLALVAAASRGWDKPLALSAPGRSGVGAAAAAATTGLDSRVIVPSRAPFAVKALINVHDGDMRVVPGRYPDAESAYLEEAGELDWIDTRPVEHPFARAGRTTACFELLADLDWSAPDVIVLPVGSGATLLAFAAGLNEALESGLIEVMPRLVVGQPAGCAPLVRSIRNELPPEPWSEPDTICGELEIPAPMAGELIVETAVEVAAAGIAVPDPAALEAAVRTAQADGLQISVAGGVAAAAATDLSTVGPTDTVVILNPGTATIDADVLRSHLMGQGI